MAQYLNLAGVEALWGKIKNTFALKSHSHDYLPLSGGTLQNGTSTAPLILNTTSSTEIGIKLNMSDVNKGWVGYSASTGYGTYLYNSASNKYIGIKDDGTPHYQGNTLIHSGNIGNQSVSYANSATTATTATTATLLGDKPLSALVKINKDNRVYTDVSHLYMGGTTPTYYRIVFPDNVLTAYNMVNIEVFFRQKYSDNTGGKIIINTHNPTNKTWNGINAYVYGYFSTNIKVYGYGGKYIYIEGCSSWSTINIDKILVGDNAVYQDQSSITIDYVSSLPQGYTTASMYYSYHSGNLSKTTLGLGNVENTALSTWPGSSNLTTCNQGAFGSIITKGSGDYLPIVGGTLTGNLKWNGSTREILSFAPGDTTWRSGLKYSWSSNTTIGLWGKHSKTQFVWHAGTDFSTDDINGTTNRNYDFQVGRNGDGVLEALVGGKKISLSGHTHSKSEITDFPTSLPANGGTSTYATYIGASGNAYSKADIYSLITSRVPKKQCSEFYPWIGEAHRQTNYKVTLPYAGLSDSITRWMMVTMELILGGSYASGTNGKIFLCYYFMKNPSNVWVADQVRAIGIGNNLADNAVSIQYDITNPGVFYVHTNNNIYNTFSIQNLTANDSAPIWDFSTTTIEAVSSIPSGLTSVPLTCLDSKGDNKLYVNNNAVSLNGHSHTSFANSITVTGSVSASSGFYQSSDERLKTFYDPIKVDLEKLKKLRKNYFKFNNKDELAIGVSAQEVQSLYPELISTNNDGYLNVAYDKLSVVALAAIDKLDDDVKELKQENNDLKDQLKAIKDILKEKGIL